MKTLIFIVIFITPNWLLAQQIVDTTYNPIIQNPEYELGKGPVIFIDEGHYNLNVNTRSCTPSIFKKHIIFLSIVGRTVASSFEVKVQ